ncbi:hypothetical protein [uncultured Clostridium sp.]|uniref:hypothetical protein n=1 Tax=uncultured Clostridium sp. TaxID=59620 RepID=UPI00263A91F5|nr:hypothetical protein [uncultured Clostridium sp.]
MQNNFFEKNPQYFIYTIDNIDTISLYKGSVESEDIKKEDIFGDDMPLSVDEAAETIKYFRKLKEHLESKGYKIKNYYDNNLPFKVVNSNGDYIISSNTIEDVFNSSFDKQGGFEYILDLIKAIENGIEYRKINKNIFTKIWYRLKCLFK